MQIDLTGKSALVSGSTEGIGLATAKGLAAAGAMVWINGRTFERVEEAIEDLRKALPDAVVDGVAADLGTPEGCDTAISAVGRVDILVNNVGIFGPADFFETPDDTWQQYFDVNVMSGVRLSRALVPAMRREGWGRVIFVSSESAVNIPPDMLTYGMTKTAMLAVSRGLAKALPASGVTVNAVLPGPTSSEGFTAMLEERQKETGESLEKIGHDFVMESRPTSILQRPTTPEEVANMIVYLCSEQASATTGAAVRADGGVVDTAV